jgi:phenylacetic acid degradation operon negative regulatory protein
MTRAKRKTLGDRTSRPLTTRSIMLSLLLGSHPPEMHVGALVDVARLFGVSGGTVRTSLSRMVDRTELVADGGKYRLSEKLLPRQAEQDAGRTRPEGRWDGTWFTAIVTAERRSDAERRRFRTRAVGSKFGELRPDIWMRPATTDPPSDLDDTVITQGALVAGDDADLVGRLWDLAAIDRISFDLAADLDRAGDALEGAGADAIAPAFESLALALRQLRTEPQLPVELHPSDAGDRLRNRYHQVERSFRTTLADYLHR